MMTWVVGGVGSGGCGAGVWGVVRGWDGWLDGFGGGMMGLVSGVGGGCDVFSQ